MRQLKGLETDAGRAGERCFALLMQLRLQEDRRGWQRLVALTIFTTTPDHQPAEEQRRGSMRSVEQLRRGMQCSLACPLSDFKKKEGYKRSIELSRRVWALPAGLLRVCLFAERTGRAEENSSGKKLAGRLD